MTDSDAYARSQQAGIEHLLAISRDQATHADTAPLYRCTDQFARLMAEVEAARRLGRSHRPFAAVARLLGRAVRPAA